MKQTILDNFRKKFVMEGSDCTWNVYPEPEQMMDWLSHSLDSFEQSIREEEREKIKNKISGMWIRGMGIEIDAYNSQLKAQIDTLSLLSPQESTTEEKGEVINLESEGGFTFISALGQEEKKEE